MKTTKALLDYLATCPKSCLESFELARLNERANLRKQMMEIIDEWVETDIQARIAEWVLVRRRRRRNVLPGLADRRLGASPELPLLEQRSAQTELPDLAPNPVFTVLREAAAQETLPPARPCVSLPKPHSVGGAARTHRPDRLYRSDKHARIA